jgi:hypothetical protein
VGSVGTPIFDLGLPQRHYDMDVQDDGNPLVFDSRVLPSDDRDVGAPDRVLDAALSVSDTSRVAETQNQIL